MLPLLVGTVFAGEVVLRNDTSFDDNYTPGDDIVINLVYPECAVSVLTPDPLDLPLDLTTIHVLYASGNGTHLGDLVYSEVGLELLPTDGAPTGTGFDWGPETFVLTVSNDSLNELDLEDAASGWTALSMTEGSVAVHVCTPDPATGEAWPSGTGVMVDTNSPDDGNWMYTDLGGEDYFELSDLGVPGSWIIRAATASGAGGGDDTGGGDDGGGDDSGEQPGEPSIDSVVPDSTTEGNAEPVAVIGTDLMGATAIYFGGLPGSALVVTSDTTLQVTSPSGLPVGVHDVMAELGDGSTATLASAFTVSAEQTIATASSDDDGGCGCATHGRSLGWLAVGLVAALVRRGRRS